jgi:hypothetical protein
VLPTCGHRTACDPVTAGLVEPTTPGRIGRDPRCGTGPWHDGPVEENA